MTNRILVAEDFSSIGDISLKTALTVYNILGISNAALPVELLSSHFGWDKQPEQVMTTTWLNLTLHHWNVDFGGVYLGYLGSNELVHTFTKYLKYKDFPTVIDPAMADHGKMYAGLKSKYVHKMRNLIKQATVITPNLSEAEFLLDHRIVNIKKALQELSHKIAGQQVVITSFEKNSKIGCVYLDGDKAKTVLYPKADKHLFGSGDLFASILSALIFASNLSWADAVKTATKITALAVKRTSAKQRDVQISTIVNELVELKEAIK